MLNLKLFTKKFGVSTMPSVFERHFILFNQRKSCNNEIGEENGIFRTEHRKVEKQQ